MSSPEIERLIGLLAKLPGLGPRSARRAALYLLKHKEQAMMPLAKVMADTAEAVGVCGACGNLDSNDPCGICGDPARLGTQICVVEEVADLWALERAGSFKGRYHVIGGVLSALDGIGPEDLNMAGLLARAQNPEVTEIILALSATVDGQTTAHYITERLDGIDVEITRLAHGVPVGGELDYLDDGTISAALKARRPV
jgi:recombination protein RecR